MKCNCENGKVFAHVNYGEKDGECHSEFKWITCPKCGGTGEIPDIREEWIKTGEQIKFCMLYNRLTMRDLSAKTGFSAVQISAARFGKIDPQPLIDKIKSMNIIVPEVLTCHKCRGTEFAWVEDELLGKIRKCKGCE